MKIMTDVSKRDFHVVSMRYRLEHGDNVAFNNPPPVDFENDEARLQLKDGILSCVLKAHYATEVEAREAIEPILRAWELNAAIAVDIVGLRFIFEKAEIIDRTPIIPGQTRIFTHVGSVSLDAVLEGARVQVGRAKYPEPPATFRITPDVESLWLRFQRHLDGREPLPGMAFFCLTVVEASAGGRLAASKKYGIEKDVLRKLGELTSERGDHLTARKARSNKPMRPITGAESAWVLSALKIIILRLGDTREIGSLSKIKMSDLPTL
jgi:hypothetical protein